MKKVFLLTAVLLTTIILVGCGKKGLEGKWASQEYSGKYIYTFKADGTGNYDAAGTVREFTYKVEDNKLSILYSGDTAPFETTYTINGDTLTVKDSFGSDTIYKRK